MTGPLQSVIDGFSSGAHLGNVSVALEAAGMSMLVLQAFSEHRLMRRAEAPEQAKKLLHEKGLRKSKAGAARSAV